MLLLLAAALFSAQATLRIVVIEGEDAVNVVRQRTAVAPVVEVRDRNDQPVAGAVVRFAITRGRASFNGARALTVTTNQAGRAVATGFTANGTGALQISATAVFQGQTAAITIAQTTVLTAATSGAGAGTAAASVGGAAVGAGGGGISATTVGIVAGAAIGGTVAAKKVAGGSSDSATKYVGPYQGQFLFGAGAGGSGCTAVVNVSGLLTLDLSIAADNAVTGDATIEINQSLVQTTCSAFTTGSFVEADMAVTGSSNGFSFQKTEMFPSTGATFVVSFQGTLNGTEGNGTINQAWSGAPGSNVLSASSSFPVVLRRQ